MITLRDILNLMPYAFCDFEVDSFIQIVDNSTQAHYRKNKEGFTLGGNPVLGSEGTIFNLPVACIEYIDNHCVISVN